MTRYAVYRYMGSSPWVLIIKGEVHKLNPGDCIELPMKKPKTRQMKKLLKAIYI